MQITKEYFHAKR